MNPDGTSGFIDGGYGVQRVGTQTIYHLGCGPANAHWKQCEYNNGNGEGVTKIGG